MGCLFWFVGIYVPMYSRRQQQKTSHVIFFCEILKNPFGEVDGVKPEYWHLPITNYMFKADWRRENQAKFFFPSPQIYIALYSGKKRPWNVHIVLFVFAVNFIKKYISIYIFLNFEVWNYFIIAISKFDGRLYSSVILNNKK